MSKANLDLTVLIRASQKTGKVDMVMTGLGDAMMRLWALQNTTPTKMCFIIDKKTHVIKWKIFGKKGNDGFPDIEKDGISTCEDAGIPTEYIDSIEDDRFE